MEPVPDAVLAAILGLIGGTVLGLAARIGRFCTLGAVEDALYAEDSRGLRMWALALGVAIAVTALGDAIGLIDRQATLYRSVAFDPVGAILGGLIFGYGMAIAGNCGFGALSRLGGGDLRALLIVIVMGVSSYVTLNGPLAHLRVALFPQQPHPEGAISGIDDMVAAQIGVPGLVVALGIAAAFAALALFNSRFRASRPHVVWGIVVGLTVGVVWAASTSLNSASFGAVPVEGFTFTAPLGEALLYLMTSTGSSLSFAIGSVAGVIVGSVIGALRVAHFRWEACDDPRELGRQIGGAVLMGIGGVLALGCSVGQGLTAFSVLAPSAPLVLASIFAGGAVGLRYLIHR